MRRRSVDVIGVACSESELCSHSQSCMSGLGVGNGWSPYKHLSRFHHATGSLQKYGCQELSSKGGNGFGGVCDRRQDQ